MRNWIKLPTDILDDPKMGRLPDRLFRRIIELWLLAAGYTDNGCLPPLHEIAERLHQTTETQLKELMTNLQELFNHGFLELKAGDLYVTNYNRLVPNGDDWQRIRADILVRDCWTCQYCGATAEHVDHIIPRCQGGTNDPDNLVAACKSCNLTKSGRTPKQAGMEFYHA